MEVYKNIQRTASLEWVCCAAIRKSLLHNYRWYPCSNFCKADHDTAQSTYKGLCLSFLGAGCGEVTKLLGACSPPHLAWSRRRACESASRRDWDFLLTYKRLLKTMTRLDFFTVFVTSTTGVKKSFTLSSFWFLSICIQAVTVSLW